METGALLRRFETTASARPDAPAITFLRGQQAEPVSYTFGSLFDRARQVADGITERGVDGSAPFGLLLGSQEDQVVHYLAVLLAGGVPAILTPPNRKLNVEYYRRTMNEVLRRCGFSAVISDVEGIDIPTRSWTPTGEPTSGAGAEGVAAGVGADERLAASFLQFSSGTTGMKKGVLVTDEAVLAQLEAYARALRLGGEDRIVSWLPLYHDMGFIACLNLPLAYGVHTIMIDPIDWVTRPALYLQAVSDHGGTLSWHPNFAFAFMAQRVRDRELEEVDLSSLRGLINCSEPATHESQRAFLERFAASGLRQDVFKGCYAMAETTFALTHGEPTDPGALDPDGPDGGVRTASSDGFVSVGRPLPSVELRIVDPDSLDDLADRTVGEIWVRSPFNFTGYYNDPASTDRAFVGDWYRTGDLGYRVGDDYYVAGRLKDVLIVGGVNVFPQDIEDLVSACDGIRSGRASAFSTFDERMQTERIVILAESPHCGTDAAQATVQSVRQRVLAALQIANFELHLVPDGWLVKSTSGKMARSANREKWERLATDPADVPRTPTLESRPAS